MFVMIAEDFSTFF